MLMKFFTLAILFMLVEGIHFIGTYFGIKFISRIARIAQSYFILSFAMRALGFGSIGQLFVLTLTWVGYAFRKQLWTIIKDNGMIMLINSKPYFENLVCKIASKIEEIKEERALIPDEEKNENKG